MAKKQQPKFRDLEKVVRELIVPFYEVERAIPLLLKNGRRNENDAEHSWSVALMACLLAEHVDPSLDIGKICQFAIVHDLAEIYAGDTNVFGSEESHQTKQEREDQALHKLQKDFTHFPWLIAALTAYEQQNSAEAKFVRSIDKLVPLLFDYITEGIYFREHKHTIEDYKVSIQRPRKKAKAHAGAFAYHEEALAEVLAHPQFFHSDK